MANGKELSVSIDVSEALTGLKAVQREAKETVKALKEIETAQGLGAFSTEELWDELWQRNLTCIPIGNTGFATIKRQMHKSAGTYNDELKGPIEIMIKNK